MAIERLQKIISRSGIASRRKAEEMIVQGRVSINGEVVRELGSKADMESDHIKVDGKLLRPPSRMIYLALNKPRGYVTTRSDPEGRPTVMDLIKKIKAPVYPVGRLDYNSEGLLLLTNDGDLANRLTSTSSGILKTYLVKVRGQPQEKDIERLRQGILLDGRRTLPAQIRLMRTTEATRREPSGERSSDAAGANSWYEVIITEGRQNQIRRVFSLIGHPVQKLKRMKIGPITLGGLLAGEFRYLTPAELRQINQSRERQQAGAQSARSAHGQRKKSMIRRRFAG